MSDLAAQLDASELQRRQPAPRGPMHVSDTSPIPKIAWLSRPVRLIIICGIVLIGAVMVATGGLLSNLRDRDLVESERRLSGLALVLAEQIDRNLQSIEVIQTAVIDRL